MAETPGASGDAIACLKPVDCDVHNAVPSIWALFPYLAEHWREYISRSAFKGPVDQSYPPGAPITARPGTIPEGGPPGSDMPFLRSHVIEASNCDHAILTCNYAIESIHNPDAAAALSHAVNDWQIAEWIEKEPRFRASIVVPPQQPAMAAREIDRVGNHPGFVQVFLPVRSEAPYGNRRYHPIFEAAVRNDLAVALHFGGCPGNPPSGCGWPSYYLEEYAGMAQVFQTQLMSMIVEGVFDQFPTLRVVLVESGVTWLPAFLWRFDKEWKGLRREVPWVSQRPSEYVRDRVRLTIQPFDAPASVTTIAQVLEQLESDDLLFYATDYPHWQYDEDEGALPPGLPDSSKRKILTENAREFYRL